MVKKTGSAIAKLGARGFLSILGSMAALAGASCPPVYGPAPEYGMPACTDSSECDVSAGWYCDKSSGTGHCVAHFEVDAGTSKPDAGN